MRNTRRQNAVLGALLFATLVPSLAGAMPIAGGGGDTTRDPIPCPSVPPVPLANCLEFLDGQVATADGNTHVAVSVRNTCASRIGVDAGLTLVLRQPGTSRFTVVDGDRLVGKNAVVLDAIVPGAVNAIGGASQPCVMVQGTWSMVGSSCPKLPFTLEHCR